MVKFTLFLNFEDIVSQSVCPMNWLKNVGIFLFTSLFLVACADDDGFTDFTKSENFKILGSSAEDLLTDSKFKKLSVEIVYEEGFLPSTQVISDFTTFLEDRLYKSEINITKKLIPSTEGSNYSLDRIIEIEQKHRTAFTNQEEIRVFIYFSDARHIDDSTEQKTLGTAYLNTSIVLFGKTINEVSDSLVAVTAQTITSATLQHEFSHLLGLVNTSSSHNENVTLSKVPEHCANTKCLMAAHMDFTQYDGTKNTVLQLDNECLERLRVMGGK
ncbi:hypothetical protein NBT05_10405 [Aquimarina sp. ERC-38]|uniref:hypothetical protein n=1 Tax=Aquimarina sp. ERC-38 TaxID=2949996 RepID=UPI002246A6AF|nr:hypothetical protein [Aquimarina sp. ERC-38]UZO79381.1 hypothetical protein NBT05_10405 [Aquimarina sp. ERC-38]